jgi:tRNA (cmo5U34)-methyltransferase
VSDSPQPVDFDARPPMPVSEYEQTVRRINVGYDLTFTLVGCFLRALRKPNLELLVVGAGGGAEIERFLPENPDWRLTGVDPSRDMLAVAQAKVERLGLGDRVTLIQGTVETLPTEARFDAATCLFVLHFLPDEEKLALLRGIAARLRPDAPAAAVGLVNMLAAVTILVGTPLLGLTFSLPGDGRIGFLAVAVLCAATAAVVRRGGGRP